MIMLMKEPAISIIVPVYNAENTLDKCVASIVSQRFTDLEIILVNDGSTDKSLRLCKQWAAKDERIKVFSQHHAGVSVARNTGLGHSTGVHVMFVDSHDRMFPEMCEEMEAAMTAGNLDCVICGCHQKHGGDWAPIGYIDYTTLLDFKSFFFKHLKSGLIHPVWNKLYRRELITEGFPVGVTKSEDIIFNLTYLNNCSHISFLPTKLYFHVNELPSRRVLHVDLQRLCELEKEQATVIWFADKKSSFTVFELYIKNLCMYMRKYLQVSRVNEAIGNLKTWRSVSNIGKLKLLLWDMDLDDRILLLSLKYKIWILSIIFVRLQHYIQTKEEAFCSMLSAWWSVQKDKIRSKFSKKKRKGYYRY